MRNKYVYRIMVISVFVVLLSVGVFIGLQVSKSPNDNINNDTIDVVNKKDNDDVKIYEEEPVSTKTYDIEVIYEEHYGLCNETISNKDIVYGTTIDKLKEEQLKKQNEQNVKYELSNESNEKLVYTRTLEQNCPNHFLVKLDNGNVIIYNIVTDSTNTEYKRLDISEELIRVELMEELNNGIRVDSKEELNFLIEDIES